MIFTFIHTKALAIKFDLGIKKAQGQSRITNLIILVVLVYPMLYTKIQAIKLLILRTPGKIGCMPNWASSLNEIIIVLEKEDFTGFIIYVLCGHVGHVTLNILTIFHS